MSEQDTEKNLAEMTTEEVAKFVFPPEALEMLNTLASGEKKQLATDDDECDDDS